MAFLDALTPLAQKRRNDIYEAFHNSNKTRKENAQKVQEGSDIKSFIKRIKTALGL